MYAHEITFSSATIFIESKDLSHFKAFNHESLFLILCNFELRQAVLNWEQDVIGCFLIESFLILL